MFDFKFDNIYSRYMSAYTVKDNCLYSTGKNDSGQLGLDIFEPPYRLKFEKINMTDVKSISGTQQGIYI